MDCNGLICSIHDLRKHSRFPVTTTVRAVKVAIDTMTTSYTNEQKPTALPHIPRHTLITTTIPPS